MEISVTKELVFRDKIGRNRHDRRKRIVDTKMDNMLKHVRLKQYQNKTSLVRLQTKDRTHQIRVHLSHHNFPIWATLSIIVNQRVGATLNPRLCPSSPIQGSEKTKAL